jgi:hypothetical protein
LAEDERGMALGSFRAGERKDRIKELELFRAAVLVLPVL